LTRPGISIARAFFPWAVECVIAGFRRFSKEKQKTEHQQKRWYNSDKFHFTAAHFFEQTRTSL
jgi:hypothetical protein